VILIDKVIFLRGETRVRVHEEATQTLTGLGFTVSQAKVYLALCALEKATARTLSQHSKVARQEVYRILDELHERGLVEKIIAAPTEFKPVPMEECLSILIERKKSEISETQKKATKLLRKLKKTTAKKTLQEEVLQFSLISEREALIRLRKAAEAAQASIDFISRAKSFLQGSVIFEKSLDRALAKGVKIRGIVEESEKPNSFQKIAQAFMKNPSFKLKIISSPPNVRLGIYDKKEVSFVAFPNCDMTMSPILWTNNLSFVSTMLEYFEMLWSKAVEPKPEEHSPNSQGTANNP
jgi:sugar-specific transcriptional regulator TrmB